MQALEEFMELGQPSAERKEKRASERLHRFNEAQSLLPEDLRLANRTDINEVARKSRTRETIVQYKRAVRMLMETTQSLGKVRGETGHGLQYFLEDAELPEPPLLKQYMIYIATSNKGFLHDGALANSETKGNAKISMKTLQSYLGTLLGALSYFNGGKRYSRSVRDDLLLYMRGMKETQGIHDKVKPKPIVLKQDLTEIIKITWSVEYMYLFPESQRHHLHLVLGVNLLMDNAIRVGEISYNSAYQEIHQTLRWTDVEIIAYPAAVDANSQPELWVLLH